MKLSWYQKIILSIDGETFVTEIIHRFQPMGGYVINILASQKLNIIGNFSAIFSSFE